ncbi:MAG: SAM-dependent chlorinase/fluorinase [Bacteroidota bacterium]|nr:SAM-dependent chlorinase/fluorinase [Bacteroidota bacterium]
MIITLTSDYGLSDNYVGILKGMLYSKLPQCNLVDISHNVTPFSVSNAAYMIGGAYKYFPEQTVHLIMVDAEISQYVMPVVVFWKNHYFVTVDNGILSILTRDDQNKTIFKLPYRAENRDTYLIEIATAIAQGQSILDLGGELGVLKEMSIPNIAVNQDDTINGIVIHNDRYGNAITNIKRDDFEKIRAGRNYEISFRNSKIYKVYNSYIDITHEKQPTNAEKLAIFNSNNLLEIALWKASPKNGTATTLLGLELNTTVSVKFFTE